MNIRARDDTLKTKKEINYERRSSNWNRDDAVRGTVG
jgi:hypothetical protein